MPTTQQDIAIRVKVSRSLVGQVLSGRPGNFVSDGTKQLILRTARDLNYHPNASARSLRTGKSHAVGMFSVRATDPGYMENLGGLSVGICAEILSAAGYELKVKVFPDRDSLLAGMSESARGGVCDAFLISGMDTEKQGMLLEEMGVPFAAYGRFEVAHPDWLQVDYDNETMMHDAVTSLANRNRTMPVLICHDTREGFNNRLIAGFKAACASCWGRAVRDDMILKLPSHPRVSELAADRIGQWMAMPDATRPDSLVMGVQTKIPQVIEEQLWGYGKRIGFGDNDFAICGACDPDHPWLVGDYLAFDSLDGNDIARALTEEIMLPLLRGEAVERTTIRIVPKLHERSGMKLHALKNLAAIAAQL